MSEAEHCDRLALMDQGLIVASGSPPEMRQHVERKAGIPLLLGARKPLSVLHALREAGFRGAALAGRRVRFLSPNREHDAEHIRRLLADRDIEDVSIERASVTMQDVFVCHVLAQQQTDQTRKGD
jgi:ABC-2 type transport system ATP-binding protein